MGLFDMNRYRGPSDPSQWIKFSSPEPTAPVTASRSPFSAPISDPAAIAEKKEMEDKALYRKFIEDYQSIGMMKDVTQQFLLTASAAELKKRLRGGLSTVVSEITALGNIQAAIIEYVKAFYGYAYRRRDNGEVVAGTHSSDQTIIDKFKELTVSVIPAGYDYKGDLLEKKEKTVVETLKARAQERIAQVDAAHAQWKKTEEEKNKSSFWKTVGTVALVVAAVAAIVVTAGAAAPLGAAIGMSATAVATTGTVASAVATAAKFADGNGSAKDAAIGIAGAAGVSSLPDYLKPASTLSGEFSSGSNALSSVSTPVSALSAPNIGGIGSNSIGGLSQADLSRIAQEMTALQMANAPKPPAAAQAAPQVQAPTAQAAPVINQASIAPIIAAVVILTFLIKAKG